MENRIDGVRLNRLQARNYKSIEACDVRFDHPLTLMVGRNGVGKSNVLDALRFVADALGSNLDYAVRERGGIDKVRRKSLGGRPTNPQITLHLSSSQGHEIEYGFKIAAVQGRSFRVAAEWCKVIGPAIHHEGAFRTEAGDVVDWRVHPPAPSPPVAEDRLFLVNAAGLPVFRIAYDLLVRMAFHNLNPDVMRYPSRPEPGERLARDGHNLPSVVKRLRDEAPERLERVTHFLQALGTRISEIRHKHAGALETIEIAQETDVPDGLRNTTFDAVALSDGTLRALGILVSLQSSGSSGGAGPTLIGIEEPETALHPAAVGALVEALIEGSEHTQVILTCHSPDMLDHEEIVPAMIRVVILHEGSTFVGPISPAKQALIQDHLVSAGELLQKDQLTVDPQGMLFEPQA